MKERRKEFLIRRGASHGADVTDLDENDVLFKIREDSNPSPEMERYQTQESTGSSAHTPDLITIERFLAEISTLLRGPGDLTTAPAQTLLLESAMLKRHACWKIAVGSLSSGPFVDGETITGAPSGATGRVFRNLAADGDLKYTVLSGTFEDGDTVTGGTSGATATQSGAPAAQGSLFIMSDSDFETGSPEHHFAAEFNKDGFAYRGRGILSNAVMEFANKEPAILRNSLMGALTATVDKALPAVTSYPEDGAAIPVFVNIGFALGAWTPTDIVSMTLDLPQNVALRGDAQEADGLKFADYDRGEVVLRLQPFMPRAAVFDLYAAMRAATLFATHWVVGSEEGRTWDFYADAAQIISGPPGNRDGNVTTDLELKLTGAPNQPELYIWAH